MISAGYCQDGLPVAQCNPHEPVAWYNPSQKSLVSMAPELMALVLVMPALAIAGLDYFIMWAIITRIFGVPMQGSFPLLLGLSLLFIHRLKAGMTGDAVIAAQTR